MHFEKCTWSAEAEAGLSETFHDERDTIKQDVDEGRAELWKIDNGTAWLITRIEGHELVIVCAQGRHLRKYANRVFQVARSQNLLTVRFHTTRPALARLLPLPAFEIERVYRVRL